MEDRYEFAFDLNGSEKNEPNMDIWGAATLLDRKHNCETGVEYNYYVETYKNSITGKTEVNNCSAIYYMETFNERMETDTAKYVHYEVDFSDKDWKEKLKQAMIEAYEKFDSEIE